MAINGLIHRVDQAASTVRESARQLERFESEGKQAFRAAVAHEMGLMRRELARNDIADVELPILLAEYMRFVMANTRKVET